MRFRLDPKSDIPLYRQLMAQVRAMIASGRLRAGDRLPSVRELAVDLRINPNTVARAYRDLDRIGVLETRGASGSFVSNGQVMLARKRREEEYRVKLREALTAASGLGIDPDLARELFDELAGGFFPTGGADDG
jgi:GntR family transcriptional regulator